MSAAPPPHAAEPDRGSAADPSASSSPADHGGRRRLLHRPTKSLMRLVPKPDPVATPATGPSLWNLPNALTMLRLLLVIPFGWLLFSAGAEPVDRFWGDSLTWAAVIFAVASVTDFLDGALARKHGLVTTFGKVADPIADKALTGVALIGLSYLHDLSWWVTFVILFREIAVTVLRFWVIKYGVIAASHGGKAKTVAQIVAIFLYLLPLAGIGLVVREVVMGIAVILTVVTGVDYLLRALRLRYGSLPHGSAV